MTTEKYAGTQTIARAFALINLFTNEQPVWSLLDLIAASGLKRTTVFRLLSALGAEQIMRKTETGDYTLGPGLIALGVLFVPINCVRWPNHYCVNWYSAQANQ